MEKANFDKQITVKQLTDNSYQLNKSKTDNSLTAKELNRLPVPISEGWEHAVINHINYFGWKKVMEWAEVAATKNKPEHYLMKILSRQRQKHGSIDAKIQNAMLDKELNERLNDES